jgi:hypothetical protein
LSETDQGKLIPLSKGVISHDFREENRLLIDSDI